MKIIISTLSVVVLSFFGLTQITSNPGSNSWTSPAAWVGGVVPTINDAVIIGLNSTIILDVPIVHSANIDIDGGVLTSVLPANDLTVNNANLTVHPSSQLAFSISSPVFVTINDGVLTNDGVFMSGNLYITYVSALSNNVNNGDMMISGTMTVDGNAQFDNYLGCSVSGQMTVNTDAGVSNYSTANVGAITNHGMVVNNGTWIVNDAINNSLSGTILSSGGSFMVGTDVNNDGNITIDDNMEISGSLNNSGAFMNNGGAVAISTNLLNSGTMTGSSSGSFLISMNSENTVSGAITGVIDVCDTSLSAGNYLDIDNGQANIDFNTVTFCTNSFAGIEDNIYDYVKIAPNPTEGNITIEGVENAVILVYSTDGRLRKRCEMHGASNEIDLSILPSGFYTLKIDSGNVSTTKRFIKL